MVRRSLRASAEGIKKAKQAFKRKQWTQEYLAAEVGLETRQPIWKFFAGKPIDRFVFTEICFRLELELEDIAEKPEFLLSEAVIDSNPKIDTLVQKLRSVHYDKIQDQCGILHLLDIARPIELADLYVDVNILEEITNQRWLEISEFQGLNTAFDRFGLAQVREHQVPGLKAVAQYPKLMVLGKPGAGKTTFLQSIALQCNCGDFQPQRLPIFISLKSFAEDSKDLGKISIVDYINQEFSGWEVSEAEIETILHHGSALILLDGLDEVAEGDSYEVIKQIRKLTETYYKNQFIITCRIAAQQYKFKGFTEVEIADFDKNQIAAFAHKWFVAVARKTVEQGRELATQFMEKLELPENWQIRELAITPILLNLTCLVFQTSRDFPAKRAELYRQGLDLLLVRWDEARGIKRDAVYRNLSLLHKMQLLSWVAAITFEKGDYFFQKSNLQQLIADYLRQMPNTPNAPDALQLDSEAVLKSIEVQHGLLVERAKGIYSFSHLTFQEYFTARAIVMSSQSLEVDAPMSLAKLVGHLYEKRWREVFLLTSGLLQPADSLLLLLKQQLDAFTLVTATAGFAEELQPFLTWVAQKSHTIYRDGSSPHLYHPASIRAFYLTLALPHDHHLARNLDLALAIDQNFVGKLTGELAIDLALVHALSVTLSLTPELMFARFSAITLALELDHLLLPYPSSTPESQLRAALQHLKEQLPHPSQGREELKEWWQANGQDWVAQLRTVMICHRQIGHDWQLTQQQLDLLEQYWDANKLLVDCLHNSSYITNSLRQHIQKTLLLLEPFSSI